MLLHDPPGSLLAFLVLSVFCTGIQALQVAPGSPCAAQCLDAAPKESNTTSSDIVCSDLDFFKTYGGVKFKDCVDCLQTSRQVTGDESDVAWLLYNLRYASDACLFGVPGDQKNTSSPCDTEWACGPLRNAIQVDSSSPTSNEFGYCTANNSVFRGQARSACSSCLQASGDSSYVSNFLVALEAGCEQQPSPGSLLGLSSSLFTQSAVTITNPPANDTSSDQPHSTTQMTIGAIVGIVVGVALLLIGGAALFIVYWRRQRRFNKDSSFKHGDRGYVYSPESWGSSFTATNAHPSISFDDKDPPYGSQRHIISTRNHGDAHLMALSHNQIPTTYEQSWNAGGNSQTVSLPAHPAYVPRATLRRETQIKTAANLHTTPLYRSDSQLAETRAPSRSQTLPLRIELTQPSATYQSAVVETYASKPSQLPTIAITAPQRTQSRSRSPPKAMVSTYQHHQHQQPNPALQAAASQPYVLPPPPSKPPPPKVPELSLPTASRLKQRRQYSPPRIPAPFDAAIAAAEDGRRGERPIAGRENMAITGPLAFPVDASAAVASRPTFVSPVDERGEIDIAMKFGPPRVARNRSTSGTREVGAPKTPAIWK